MKLNEIFNTLQQAGFDRETGREPMIPKGTPIRYNGDDYIVSSPNEYAEDSMLGARPADDPDAPVHWLSIFGIEADWEKLGIGKEHLRFARRTQRKPELQYKPPYDLNDM